LLMDMSATSVVVGERRGVKPQLEKEGFVGKPLKRIEDLKLVRGLGGFIGDLRVDGMVYAAFVRSPHAHARIVGVDSSEALKLDGVIGVLTAKDLEGVGNLPTVDEDAEKKPTPRRPLAVDVTRYVGEAVAVVLARIDTRLRTRRNSCGWTMSRLRLWSTWRRHSNRVAPLSTTTSRVMYATTR